jgi:enamine deaminase RidA (YjgF/YER057c/UK114 family)
MTSMLFLRECTSAKGISHAIQVGDLLEVSGQVSYAEGLEAQADRAFAAINAIISAARGTMADIVKMTIYTTQPDCWDRTAAVRGRYLPDPPPAATMVVVVGLAHPSLMLEIDVTAVVGSGRDMNVT